MSDKHSITNVYCAYVENKPYEYPSRDVTVVWAKDAYGRKINTGWQIIPNILWSHVCTPKQWAELVMNYEAYHVSGINCTLFNPVPITTNIAIQRTNLFAAFNNCTYMWGYEDDLYETSYHPWADVPIAERLNLAFKEGIWFGGDMGMVGSSGDTTHTPDTGPGGGGQPSSGNYTWKRYKFSPYYWRRPDHRTPHANVWSQGMEGGNAVFDVYPGVSAPNDGRIPIPSGIFWDPLNRPDKLMELRAGKNSMSYNWSCAPCDEGKWYNIDQLAAWAPWTPAGPYCGAKRPKTFKYSHTDDPDQCTSRGLAQSTTVPVESNLAVQEYADYTLPDFSDIPVVPNTWFWQEIRSSIVDATIGSDWWKKPDKYWPGTEWEQYKYPPTQWFVKGIPLFDEGDNLIRTTTQIAAKITIHLECKKRRSALYCPTWGPFAGKQLYRHNDRSQIYQPAMVRYRTGGARRTWQNINRKTESNQANNVRYHAREDPYFVPTEEYGSNVGLPRDVDPENDEVDKNASMDSDQLTITTTRGGQPRVVYRVGGKTRPRPRERSLSPARTLDIDMMEDLQKGP